MSAPPASAASTASVSASPAVAPSSATAASPAAVAPGPPATEAEPPPPAQPPAANPLDARWKANINLVLDHLLPQLRTRQLRGAVVQTLERHARAEHARHGAAARRRAALASASERAAAADFLALLGTGLTGAYYANAGSPRRTRGRSALDPELAFAWAGAPPADGVPGRELQRAVDGPSAAASKAPHTFYISTDGAVRLALKVDGAERVLIDQPTRRTGRRARVGADRARPEHARRDHASSTATRAARRPLSLQFGTGPAPSSRCRRRACIRPTGCRRSRRSRTAIVGSTRPR